MPDPTPAVPAAAPASPPAGEPPQTPALTSPAEPGAAQPTEDLATVKAKLEKSVQAEKNLRARLKEAEAAEARLKELEQKDLSETERLKTQLAELQAQATKATVEANRARAQVVAQAHGYEPQAAALWLENQQQTDWTEDGIKAALANAPAWVKAQQQPGVTTPVNNPGRQGGTLTLEQINQMTPEQIAANYEAVNAALRASKT